MHRHSTGLTVFEPKPRIIASEELVERQHDRNSGSLRDSSERRRPGAVGPFLPDFLGLPLA